MKRIYPLLLILIFFSFPAPVIGRMKILMIHSYSPDLLWVMNQEKAIKEVLGSQRYGYHQFYMDTKRIPAARFRDRAIAAAALYKKINPDLVFLTDDNALKYAGPLIGKRTPIVFTGINGHIRTDYPWVLNQKNITGVFERPVLKRAILTMIDVLGLDVKKILIIMGDSTTGKAFFREAFKGKVHLGLAGRPADVILNGRFEDWKSIVLSAKEKGYGLIMPIANQRIVGPRGRILSKFEVARWVSQNSPVPFFTIHREQIRNDMAVGGMVLNGYYMGEHGACLAKKILENQMSPSELKFQIHEKTQMIFSRRQLERWQFKVSPRYMDMVYVVP